jgi:phage terminase large subunit-like protein
MVTATIEQDDKVIITHSKVMSWCDGILNGTIPACKWTKLAVQRFYNDLENGHERGLYLDWDTAQIWVDFFLCLNHFEGKFAGQPIELDNWELFIVVNVFGWYKDDGTRRFKKAYNEIARKVGKSTFAAGIGLGGLVIDNESGPQIYSIAVDKQHARKVLHSKAEKYVKHSPSLRKRLTVTKSSGRISFDFNDGIFEPLGKDSDSGEGFNPHFSIFDELHAHKTREMYDVIDSAHGARVQPLDFVITTAGFDINSFCYTEIRDYACKVLEDTIKNDEYFAIIFTIDEGDDPLDEKCWAKANPQSYFDDQIDNMRSMAKIAAEKPGSMNNFLVKRLNVWTTQYIKWVNIPEWQKSPAIMPRESLKGKPCFTALDLSANQDTTSKLNFFQTDDDKFTIIPKIWIPGDKINSREHRDAAQYVKWQKEGLITVTPGNVIDYDIVMADIKDDFDYFDIKKMVYDPWGPAEKIRQDLMKDGVAEEKMFQFRQTIGNFSPAMVTLERLYLEHKIAGLNHPVILWMASNVEAYMDCNANIRPVKATRTKGGTNATKRIDAFVCLVMCIGAWMTEPAPKKSVYEERGILSI